MSAHTLVIGTGTANTASVLAGLRRVGADPELTQDPRAVQQAERVVLPGVGTFAAARAQLDQQATGQTSSLAQVVQERVRAGRPTLAICLGMQLLFDGSEENPEVPGLGLIPGRATRFSETVRVPQLGWNAVEAARGCEILQSGYAYYANSYRLVPAAPGWWTGAGPLPWNQASTFARSSGLARRTRDDLGACPDNAAPPDSRPSSA